MILDVQIHFMNLKEHEYKYFFNIKLIKLNVESI